MHFGEYPILSNLRSSYWNDVPDQYPWCRPSYIIENLIHVLLPNGGENWMAGTNHNIQWQTSPDANIPNVKIEISDNNGITWSDVNTVPNTGSYNWLVPQVTSNQCLVRISDANDANVFDVSDNTFIIFVCQLNSKADLNNDCKVNTTDLALFANDWLKNGNPFDPNCTECPAGMVIVPGGQFPYQNGPPIFVDSFYIDKYEVTNEAYCQFLNSDADPNRWDWRMEINRSPVPPYFYTVRDSNENYPIRYVSVYDANAYAQWKSTVEGAIYRLPTEEEWEKAAAWDPVEPNHYLYGFHKDTIDCNWCNYNNCYGGTPSLVGSFDGTGGKNNAKSYYGCYDMSGNICEWTGSNYSGGSGPAKVIRGGNFDDIETRCQTTDRNYGYFSDRGHSMGFRLVRELK